MKKVILFSILFAIGLMDPVAADKLGKTTCSSSESKNVADWIWWCGPFTITQNGTLDSLTMMIQSTGTDECRMAIYKLDGANFILVDSSLKFSMTAETIWRSRTAQIGYSLVSGEKYVFAAWMANASTNNFKYDSGTSSDSTYGLYRVYSGGTWPTTQARSGLTFAQSGNAGCGFITYTITGGGGATTVVLNKASTIVKGNVIIR